MKSLLLISGPIAVGKSAVAEVLITQFNYVSLKSSTFLRTVAFERGIPSTRSALQNLGDELDRATDYRWLINDVAIPQCNALPEQARWLVDCVRKKRQILHFRNWRTDAVLHVHFTAAEQTLQRRYTERGAGTGGALIPYSMAISHENERAARELIDIADLVIDLDDMTPGEAASRIDSQRRGTNEKGGAY